MMIKTIAILLLSVLPIKDNYAPLEVVAQLASKAERIVNKGNYQGSVYNYAMVEWADCLDNPTLTRGVEDMFLDFENGTVVGTGNFENYKVGGVGAAYMDYTGLSQALSKMVQDNAQRMFEVQPRSSDGVMSVIWRPNDDMVFIDAAFTVVPYFLYVGLKYDRKEYVDLAVHQALRSFEVLLDRENGILHQSRREGYISKDHWSRANGWGSLAMAALVRDLPADHPLRAEVEKVAKGFFTSLLAMQDENGMFHQELTRPDSFVETSGTGLILFGIGTCIEKGLLPASTLAAFEKGLSGLLDYIWKDGSINNTSAGYMSEHGGDIFNCVSHNYIYNEPHAFGPVMLPFIKAHQLGIGSVKPMHSLGLYADPTPTTETRMFIRNYTQYNKTVAWESDKIAFRMFHETVANKCGSGIDVVGKKVPYPVWDRFYENNSRGISYHEDHGEGCDFYDAGFARGCGGTALFDAKGSPVVAGPFREISITRNDKEGICVTFFYDPIVVNGKEYAESKTISMELGSQFFDVTSVFEPVGEGHVEGEILKVGVGLSRLGKGTRERISGKATLVVWEKHPSNPDPLGTAVIAPKSSFKGYTTVGKDEYVLMNVPAGQPVSYKVGAAWAGAGEVLSMKDWKAISAGLQSAWQR